MVDQKPPDDEEQDAVLPDPDVVQDPDADEAKDEPAEGEE